MSQTLNSKLIYVAITTCFGILASLSAWIGSNTHELSVKLSSLQQMVLDGKEARLAYQSFDTKTTADFINRNDDSHRRIETTVATLVSRPEFESRIAELRIELKQLDQKIEDVRLRLSNVELELKNLKGKEEKRDKVGSNIGSGTSLSLSAGMR